LNPVEWLLFTSDCRSHIFRPPDSLDKVQWRSDIPRDNWPQSSLPQIPVGVLSYCSSMIWWCAKSCLVLRASECGKDKAHDDRFVAVRVMSHQTGEINDVLVDVGVLKEKFVELY